MLEDLQVVKEGTTELLSSCITYAKKNNLSEHWKTQLESLQNTEYDLYQIAIIGFMKRGKSTLLNTLLGRKDNKLAPTSANVCTAIITKYMDKGCNKDEEYAVVEFLNNGEEPYQENRKITFDELSDYINNQKNPENEKRVKLIKVYGDFPEIKETVAIVDTPGKGSNHAEHDIVADEFLPQADAIILTFAANYPCEEDERAFLRKLRDMHKFSDKEMSRLIPVMTKCDLVTENELKSSLQYVKEQLAIVGVDTSNVKIYETAAKQLYKARSNDNITEADLEKAAKASGMADLTKAINDVISEHSDKTANMKNKLNTVINTIGVFVTEEKVSLENAIKMIESTTQDLQEAIDRRRKENDEFHKAFEVSKATFEHDWDYVVDKYIGNLGNVKKQQILDEVREDIKNNGKSWGALKEDEKALPRKLADKITVCCSGVLADLNAELKPVMNTFTKELANATQTINTKFHEHYHTDGEGTIGGDVAAGTVLAGGIGGAIASTAYFSSLISTALTTTGAGFGWGWLTASLPVAATVGAPTLIASAVATGGLSLLIGGVAANYIAKKKRKSNMIAQAEEIIQNDFESIVSELKSNLLEQKNRIINEILSVQKSESDRLIATLEEAKRSLEQHQETSYLDSKKAMLGEITTLESSYVALQNTSASYLKG